MSFYSVDVTHPIAEADQSKSGRQTATAAWVRLNGKAYSSAGVWVMNNDEDDGLDVRLVGSTEGIRLAPTQDRFFPVDRPNKLEIRRSGTANVVASYWVA